MFPKAHIQPIVYNNFDENENQKLVVNFGCVKPDGKVQHTLNDTIETQVIIDYVYGELKINTQTRIIAKIHEMYGNNIQVIFQQLI